MLTATFIHAPGIGSVTERALWEQGAISWTAFLESPSPLRVPPRHRATLQSTVESSVAALEEARADYFAQALPKKEHWRAARAFPKLGYLDIETDGGMDGDSVTVIGLYDGCETHLYVKDQNLAQFAYDCQDYDGFVTFFGTGFDLPMLKRRFPVLQNVFTDRLHIDLCPLLKRLGHQGGLKRIEQSLGITRGPEAEGLSGLDAVRLWRVWRRGGRDAEEALHVLLAYNREDVVNMKTLLLYVLPRLQQDAGYNASGNTDLLRKGDEDHA
jgi:uncharacterized protein YprB with RNaseH-like and TPR domain